MSNFSLNNEAVRRYLTRALTGDAERPRPPVTLAGQHPDKIPQQTPPPAPPSTPPPPIWRTRPIYDRPKSNPAVPEPGDEQGAYSREELLRMDHRFRTRLQRALDRGKESRRAAAHRIANPLW